MTQTTLPNRTCAADARIPALTFKTLRRYAAALGARRFLTLVLGMLALTPAFAANLILDNGTAQFSTIGTWTPSTAVAGFEGSNYQYHTAPTSTTLVVDNRGQTATGTWWESSLIPGYLGSNYQYHEPGTGAYYFTWRLALTGSYRVYARWTADTNRASNAVYTVRHSAGESQVTVNQQQNGGAWQLLGTYTLDTNSQVTLSDAANGYVIADGVKAEPTAVPDTATWTAPLTATAQYDVYAKWTANGVRASNALYRVTHSSGESQVTVNQRLNGGQWNLLGRYTLAPGQASVTLSTAEADGLVIADAIELVPVAASGPTVSLTAPASGATFTAPANITLTATADAGAGTTISKVEFYNGTTLLGTATSAPYSYTWNNVSAGSYTLSAKATDNTGGQATTGTVTITVATGAAKLYYLHTDALNTPRLVTDGTNKVVWRNNPLSEPFGLAPPEEDPDGDAIPFTLNLRFPGQVADKETNLNYNYYRDYNPNTGRYIQSDPIGLQGGINTYTYVRGNPVSYSDPRGLCGPFTPLCIFLAEYGVELAVGAEVAAAIATGTPNPGSSAASFGGRVVQEATHDVYLGWKAGQPVYVGISKDIASRTCQHGERFDAFTKLTASPVTKDQARALEQVILEQNPQYQNAINSISPTRDWYTPATDWAKRVLGIQ